MIKNFSFPTIFFIIGLILFFLQTQLNFYFSTNIKTFEFYSILLFILIIPNLIFRKNNIKNFNFFLFIIFLIIYSNIILFLKYSNILETINTYNFFETNLWQFFSVYNFLSILFFSCFILLLKKNELRIIFKILYFFGIFILFESFFHTFFIFFDFNSLWSSDIFAGNRFHSLLFLDSSDTAIILSISFVYYLIINRQKLNLKVIIIIFIYLYAIILTKERSVILFFVIFNILFFLKNIKQNKFLTLFVIILIPIMTFTVLSSVRTSVNNSHFILTNFQTLDKGDNLNFDLITSDKFSNTTAFSIKSTISRLVLLLRSYEISKSFFPIGSGPGSQIYFIYNDIIEFKFLRNLQNNLIISENFFNKLLLFEINQFFMKTGYLDTCNIRTKNIQDGRFVINKQGCVNFKGNEIRTMSPHNLFADFIISLGLFGLLFSIYITIIMFSKFNNFLLQTLNQQSILNLSVSLFFIIFIFGSYYNIFWLFILLLTMSNFKNIINE